MSVAFTCWFCGFPVADSDILAYNEDGGPGLWHRACSAAAPARPRSEVSLTSVKAAPWTTLQNFLRATPSPDALPRVRRLVEKLSLDEMATK